MTYLRKKQRPSEKKVNLNRYGKRYLQQIFLYSIITSFFFMIAFKSTLIFFISVFIIVILSSIYVIKNYFVLKWYVKVLIFFGLEILILGLLLERNILYFIVHYIFPNPIGLETVYDGMQVWGYYGILAILAFLSELVIMLIYFKKGFLYTEDEDDYGMWGYFVKNPSIKKWILLILLLSVASIFEEIVFRFTLINIGVRYRLPNLAIILISSIVFGLAHYRNGGWEFCVNSTFAGLVFAHSFLTLGLYPTWFLHFLWNFLIVSQMLLPAYLERKLLEEQKGKK